MDRKAKRNKELYTATVLIRSGTQVQDLMTGALYWIEKDSHYSAWYQTEKMQWFYWTLFFKTPDGRETVAKVRRDKATIKSGTLRFCHRDVIQKRTARIIRSHSFEHMRIPPPPRIKKTDRNREVLSEEWKAVYQSLCNLERNIYIKRPWTENRRLSYLEYKKRREEQKRLAAENQNPGVSPESEDEETPGQA